MMKPGAELPKTMLILKSHPSGLAATEAFLRNRGWEIFSTSDLKEALIQVVAKKHAYVLISVDHGNKKIPMLPKLIREKYDVAVIAFAESTSAVSFNSLTGSPTDYKIYAPVTGPAVERCVNKYSKDRDTLSKLQVKNEENYQLPVFLKAEDDISSVFISGKQQPRRGYGTVHTLRELRSERDIRIQELRKVSDANDSLIARATQTSLLGNVEILDGQVLNKIQEITMPTCIRVESAHFSGYLVAALGKDQKIEETLIKKIQEALFKFLKDNGEEISETEALNLKLKQVDFASWSLEYGDFLKTTVHKGSEMAMAFFPRKPIAPILEESHHPDMAKIRLLDLQGDRTVEFDLYMHLAANNKFILYTPKGGVFYTKQLERLKDQGVTHLHIQKDAAESVSKYHAQNYLNDLIDDYEEKQRIFSGPAA
jgi:hypothetical protein